MMFFLLSFRHIIPIHIKTSLISFYVNPTKSFTIIFLRIVKQVHLVYQNFFKDVKSEVPPPELGQKKSNSGRALQ